MKKIKNKLKIKSPKKLAKIALVLLISLTIVFLLLNKPSKEEKIIFENLKDEIEVKKAEKKGNRVMIDYEQPLEAEDPKEFIDNWVYILGLVNKTTPGAETIVVNCNFEDGEKVKITAPANTVKAFISEEISTEEFFKKIKIEPLTKGPRMD